MDSTLDLVDQLTALCVRKVAEVNDGKDLTPQQWANAVARTFETAFTQAMDKMEAEDPELAERFRAAYIAEYVAHYGDDGDDE